MSWTADEWRRVGMRKPEHLKPAGYDYAGRGIAKAVKEKPAVVQALVRALRDKPYVVRQGNATQGIRG